MVWTPFIILLVVHARAEDDLTRAIHLRSGH